MKITLLIIVAVLSSCALDTSTGEQALCTIEDQQAGTCPPTAWLVELAVDQAEEQYGTSEAHWAQCVRESTGWKCTTRIDFTWGWVLTTCHFNGVCWSITSPTSIAAPLAAREPSLCTEEDQQNGNCGDGGGGSPPATADVTEQYADSVVLSQPVPVVNRAVHTCTSDYRRCHVVVDFGAYYIDVSCDYVSDESYFCTSIIHPYPSGG